ncbi:FAD-dependent oxidoreductase [Microbispora sp. ATCC PTA-5024]|uniref:FAD-dependent oxidoreductase n=1 Tax=Microbispora sp. ATCC PTA-5024 TaxID=316330 RepID=UPI000413B5E8|nr:FAD-dependent oxidoreductase [Microbispora sp. ATCC PTA-5024]
MKVLVVGSGVSGLSCAITLAENGFEVLVVTAEDILKTTSAFSGAMWTPHPVGPAAQILRWATQTYRELASISESDDAGVRMLSGVNAAREPVDDPPWAARCTPIRRVPAADLPDGYADGFTFVAPVVDMPRYLTYLRERLAHAGGRVKRAVLGSLGEVLDAAPIVVNCAGLGARELVPDATMRGVRGELVVTTNPGIDRFFAEISESAEEMLYIYPHASTVVLGGIAVEDEDARHRPEEAEAILKRCAAVESRLNGAEILGFRTGIRPARPVVRVEAEVVAGTTVIHDYGHGGAGVSLSWGCARTVRELAELAGQAW